MTDITDIEKRLRAVDHMSVEDCFLQSPLFAKAADALTAERERAEKAERELHTVLARETATQARHDKRLDDLEAELARLRAVSDFNTHTNAPDPDGAVYRVMEKKLADAEAELARLRAPVGDVGEVVKRLTAFADGTSNEGMTFGWQYAKDAADLLTRQAAETERLRGEAKIEALVLTEHVAALQEAGAERDEAVGVLETAPVVAVACDMKCKECDCGFKPWDDRRQAFLAKLETKP